MRQRHLANAAIVWLIIVVFIGYLGVILWSSYAAYERRTAEGALSVARLVAQHATSRIDVASSVLQEVVDSLQASDLDPATRVVNDRRRQFGLILRDIQARTHGVVSITVSDAEGNVVANSLGVADAPNLSGSANFRELQARPHAEPVISGAALGTVSGKWGIHVARRLALPDGRFGGMASVNLGLTENFEQFYRTVSLPDDSLITLRDTENRILVRYPVVETILGTVVHGSAGAQLVLTGESEGTTVSTSPVDGIERIVAMRRLSDYPAYAIVGFGRDAAMNGWYKELLVALYVAAGAVVAGAFLTYGLWRREQMLSELQVANQELARAHQQVDESHTQLEAANAALKEALAVAERNASHDKLTGLWNRRAFDQRLDEAVSRAKRMGFGFSLLLFDLDKFKEVNDGFGHLIGDNVLFEFAQVIGSRIRASDIFARWGGEEFILLVEATNAEQAMALAEQLRRAIADNRFAVIGKITVSIGIAEYRPEDDLENVLRRADRALYQAKTQGRDRISLG
jgi:diguanylate cyclase (GGDEF)-like protein